jgi:cell division protein FtsI/penicillin-binding protein 2
VHYRIQGARLRLVFISLILFLSLLLVRLVYLQVFQSSNLSNIAKQQHILNVKLEPKRGTIFDRNLNELAICLNLDSVYAVACQIKDKEEIANRLVPILGLSKESLLEKLNKEKYFVWLARQVSPQVSSKIKELKIPGIKLVKEPKRHYPNANLAAHVIGFAGLDNQGLEGIELYYDTYLRGTPGWYSTTKDAKQREVLSLEEYNFPPQDGYSLILTIDEVIQHIAEEALEDVYRDYRAKGATIIVMNPRNGDILAMANRPTYDLNFASDSPLDFRRNRAISDFFEPGSVFKIVAASAALQEKRFSPQDRFFCENGSYRVANHILHDHRPHGWLSFRQVIEVSSNIGVTKIAQGLGEENLYRYIKLFGFGSPTGVDLPGEVGGIAKPFGKWSKTSIACIPIGQEVAVTALQLVSAISSIANDGVSMKPRIVKSIRDNEDRLIRSFEPTVVRQVISSEVVGQLREILVGVVETGTGLKARVRGYRVAGKTGTAQKVEPSGVYSHTRFIASFVGFAPADNPAISMVVVVDEPHPFYYGGVVAAPVFQKVAEQTLRYLRISPALVETESRCRDRISVQRPNLGHLAE